MPRPDRFRSHSGVAFVSAMALVLGPTVASAQSDPYYGASSPDQSDQYNSQYDQNYSQYGQNYDAPPPPEPSAPMGYNGSEPPPAPDGYIAPSDIAAQRAADARYAAEAQAWARDNCVKSHGDVAAGAVIGGILGAIVGGSLAGRHDGGGAVVAGAALGAAGGAAVAASTGGNETSPGCPPGYVVRHNAPVYAYSYPDYYYAAPGWYRPWVYTGGAWIYRPYPYHDWYWHRYRGPSWYHDGWRGRPGWRGGPGWRGDGRGWHDGGGWHGGGGGWHDHH